MTWVRLGMAGAPLASGLALAPLLGLAKSGSFRPPALQPRRGILVVPALIVVFLLEGEAWLARRKHTAGSR
jgi:hypothetical protein